MSNIKYSDDEFINLIGKRGVMAVKQIAEWLGSASTRGIEDRLKIMAKSANPLVVNRTIVRPWISKSPQTTYILTPFGADRYNEINHTSILSPDIDTLPENYVHSLGLIDIGFAFKKMGVPCTYESRTIIDNQTNEFIRPDVAFKFQGEDRVHVVELERSRSSKDLKTRLLGRLFRWQKAAMNAIIHPDIMVLFSLDKGDNLMIAAWIDALNAFIEKSGDNPAFTVWYMDFAAFLKNPTLDLRRFNRFPVSTDPESFLLAAERERYFNQKRAEMFTPEDVDNTLKEAEDFYWGSRGRWLIIQSSDGVRRAFLDSCDSLHKLSINGCPSDFQTGSLPWLAINAIRFWLERPAYKDFRVGLIDAIREYKSSYGRGINTAANYLEKIIWESLLYKFDIGRDGPLSFRARLADDTTKQKNHTGIIPSFEIIAPWAGRESQEDADRSARSLEWLVNMLMLYPTELGLTKENKKPQSSPALKFTPSPEELSEDPFFYENLSEASEQ